ncbi:MAG: AAA family ATPase [Dehalococcoidia bacterium]|nr:AAA family ATPase [Dehalococcoidia bacterium]
MAIELELQSNEADALKAPISEIAAGGKRVLSKGSLLAVHRELDVRRGWRTVSVRWGDQELIQDDQPLPVPNDPEAQAHAEALTHWIMECFPPEPSADWADNPRLMVNRDKGWAFHSSPELDKLVRDGTVQLSTQNVGADYREWSSAQGLSLQERPPDDHEAPEFDWAAHKPPQESPSPFLAELERLVTGAFKLTPAVREEQRVPGQRASALSLALLQEVNSLLGDLTVDSEARARRLRATYRDFTGKTLRDHAAGLLVEDDFQALPISHHGGGEQAVLALAKAVSEGPVICALEEPESHLHPVLIRKLFAYLKKSTRAHQLLITTHSPVMMDKDKRTNNWLCCLDDKGSGAIERVETEADLRRVLAQLGSIPSDAYAKDVVLFVEGGTEAEVVFPIWAEKVDKTLPDNVGLISLGGKDRVLGNLQIWL